MKNQEPNIDLFGYAVNAIRGLNQTARRKLDNPDDCQRTVDWMLDNDPKYFMVHISGCRNRGRGQVYRMDNLQDYANQKLFGNQ